MYRIAVVMSTYNGEKYLASQLDSIFNQQEVETFLYIRDDGSTDGTSEILYAQKEKHDNIQIDFGENIGVGNSFMNALYHIEEKFDYYAFADQDDVWLPEKLITGIRMLETQFAPALYASNQTLTDENLVCEQPRFTALPGIRFENILRGNIISGCTFIFNSALFTVLTDERNRPSVALLRVRIHDAWVAEIAALYGTIIYDPSSYILYRQHDNNVVGGRNPSKREILMMKVRRMLNPDLCQSGTILAKELLRQFGERLAEKEEEVYSYATYRENLKSKYKLLVLFNHFRHKGESRFEYIIKILLNRF